MLYEDVQARLRRSTRLWLVTGAAGFIGSHLVEELLRLNQQVVGLDNFGTGSQRNLDHIQQIVGPEAWKRFRLIQGDICDSDTCNEACGGVDYVLHHAALGSVPASLENPLATHTVNVTGFVNVLCAARQERVRRVIYASSSAVYGDDQTLPKIEDNTGAALSPYALSKYANELYAANFHRCFGTESVGLRYFNVFGPRQSPEGPYAAVIPQWVRAMIKGEAVFVNGDGETTRDFCYVANVVQANLLAAITDKLEAVNRVYNIASGERTTLNQLFAAIRDALSRRMPKVKGVKPVYREFRPGDIRHSHADVSRAQSLLGYVATTVLRSGLDSALDWYVSAAGDHLSGSERTMVVP